jgi:hypothetical protein
MFLEFLFALHILNQIKIVEKEKYGERGRRWKEK